MSFSERTTTMAKKKISPEARLALEEIRAELRALRESLQAKIER